MPEPPKLVSERSEEEMRKQRAAEQVHDGCCDDIRATVVYDRASIMTVLLGTLPHLVMRLYILIKALARPKRLRIFE
jgi:hypothetical protein